MPTISRTSPTTTGESSVSTPEESPPPTPPSSRFTPIPPKSILAVDQSVSNTWKTVAGRKNEASSLQFNEEVRCVLIPTRDEYSQVGLIEEIYWEKTDIEKFKAEAREEILHHMDKHKVTSNTAMKHLYQPKSKS